MGKDNLEHLLAVISVLIGTLYIMGGLK